MSSFSFCSARTALCGLIVLTAQAGTSTAQTAIWTAPSSGYVYDQVNRNIRPVAGYLGSATLGPSIVGEIDWASIAPNRKSALLLRNAGMVWIPDLGTPAQAQNLDGMPVAQQLFWASDSSQAVMLATQGELVWLTNFGSSPKAAAKWSLEAESPKARVRERLRWSILAADSTADQVLLASNFGDKWELWLASPAMPPASIPFAGTPAAAVFASGTSGAFVADTAAHQIDQIRGLGANPASTPLLTSAVYVNDPAGLALSADGSRLFIADRETNLIRVFDSGSGAFVTELPGASAPQSVTVFASGLFLLGSSPPEPFLFLDTSASTRVVFVPRGE
jgi:hypothetical protein